VKLEEPKISNRREFKEKLFFAFAFLPLSCWYKSAGRRLDAKDVTVRMGGRAVA
jgi:hypothetical protein